MGWANGGWELHWVGWAGGWGMEWIGPTGQAAGTGMVCAGGWGLEWIGLAAGDWSGLG